jgi:hypothetical protein
VRQDDFERRQQRDGVRPRAFGMRQVLRRRPRIEHVQQAVQRRLVRDARSEAQYDF